MSSSTSELRVWSMASHGNEALRKQAVHLKGFRSHRFLGKGRATSLWKPSLTQGRRLASRFTYIGAFSHEFKGKSGRMPLRASASPPCEQVGRLAWVGREAPL